MPSIENEQTLDSLESVDEYSYYATTQLFNNQTHLSAKYIFSTQQVLVICHFFIFSLLLLYFNPSIFSILYGLGLTLAITGALFYKIILSCIALWMPHQQSSHTPPIMDHDWLPIYTILIPLYKENDTIIKNLFHYMRAIDYPKDKLDIKILLEADDEETVQLVTQYNQINGYELIQIPAGFPRTKAKACNYGLQLARGEYLTLYDAEDRPDPKQLKLALSYFLQSKNNMLACVQSRLNFYNYNENILSLLFAVEYTYWFDLLLPSLEYLKMPIPLGGTSNHFKTHILRNIDAWDPYNVTEDADLGIRLARLGYTTHMIPSTTYEEAPCSLENWLTQRTRWLKGYMQTYIVHMRHPLQLRRAIGIRGFLGFQLFIGGTILNNLSYAILLVIFLLTFFHHGLTHVNRYLNILLHVNFALGFFGVILLNLLGLLKRKAYHLLAIVILSPFYWVLMSLASYLALYQLLFKPSYWNKTKHGVSKIFV